MTLTTKIYCSRQYVIFESVKKRQKKATAVHFFTHLR
jgi:hypothetical protein